MNRVLITLLAGAFAVSLGACNKAEDPAEVQEDVASAQVEAQEDMAQAQADVNQDAMEGQEETALAKAEGEHKIAMERCESLSGDEQKACKDEAHATLEAAKAAASLPGPS